MPEKMPEKREYSEEEKRIFSEIEKLIQQGAEFSGHIFDGKKYRIVLKLDDKNYEYALERPLPFVVDSKNKIHFNE
jgi:2,3-bisphosphoglycerate-independent phosphoglycerate mutase